VKFAAVLLLLFGGSAVITVFRMGFATPNDRAAAAVANGESSYHVSPGESTGLAPCDAGTSGTAEVRENLAARVHTKLAKGFAADAGDRPAQEALTAELLELLTDEHTPEIIRSLSPEELHTPFGSGALEHWLRVDAAEAARWLAEHSDPTEHHALLVARRLSEDLAALLVYSDELPAGTWREHVLHQASLEMAGTEPNAAAALAQRLAPGDARTNALETVAYAWFVSDAPAALSWVEDFADTALRERLLALGARAIAVSDPDLAAEWLVDAVTDEKTRRETALSLVETWAASDAPSAARWVAEFPLSASRERALELVVRGWLRSDPRAGIAWLQRLPERDRVLARLELDHGSSPSPPDPPDL
jgi:hypothetical protein